MALSSDTLIRHGTDRGYRTEVERGETCNRCRNAHRVYQRQFRAKGKAQGLKYGSDQVIDHLYTGRNTNVNRSRGSAASPLFADLPSEPRQDAPGEPNESEHEPSLGDRLSAHIRALRTSDSDGPEYVEETGMPEYLHSIDDVDSPGPDWEPAAEDEHQFIINAAGLKKIEDNLGTYLSIIGITMEMIDPYCGPVLAENFNNIVSHWSKVIARYPKAAELFMDGKGGVIFTWIGAIQATWPFLYAIYQHHLARTVTMQNGHVFNRRTNQVMTPDFDATTPPMQPEYNYSAT
jgi:hypothetical protein